MFRNDNGDLTRLLDLRTVLLLSAIGNRVLFACFSQWGGLALYLACVLSE